jgi:hypothetical protein
MTDICIRRLFNVAHSACTCCGSEQHEVVGEAHVDGQKRAQYWVRWADAHAGAAAQWLVQLDSWQAMEGTGHVVVTLFSRVHNGRFGFMVVDAKRTEWGQERAAQLGRPLCWEEVVDQPIASEVYELLDQIIAQDLAVRPVLAAAL